MSIKAKFEFFMLILMASFENVMKFYKMYKSPFNGMKVKLEKLSWVELSNTPHTHRRKEQDGTQRMARQV